MRRIIIFSGTTEGREAAAFLAGKGFDCHVFAATPYGDELSPKGENLTVHTGRLDASAMEEVFAKIGPECIIDATHPYATEVSGNIIRAAKAAGVTCHRLLRPASETDRVISASSIREVAEIAEQMEGRIFLSTGSKELSAFMKEISEKERVTARILPARESLEKAWESGLNPGQIIAMQGPFSEEMNRVLFADSKARILVTKDGGQTGGCPEKLSAAEALGMKIILIRRPEEKGKSFEEICEALGVLPPKNDKNGVLVSIIGIGMGDKGSLTCLGKELIAKADALIGAKRMVESVGPVSGQKVFEYDPARIREAIASHPEWKNIAAVMSGDVGFYSGAKKLKSALGGYEVILVPGISSASAFAAKVGLSWEDMCLVSCHGRKGNISTKVMRHKKVFSLFGSDEEIRKLAKRLHDTKKQITMYIGSNLGDDSERIEIGVPKQFLSYEEKGLIVGIFVNEDADEQVTFGLSDESFLRGKAPMTKEEIRTLSLSKLELNRNAVVWDVGAGTGSVSLEAARLCEDGTVYAIEREAEAASLIEENRKAFGYDNLEILHGSAPEVLSELPAPSHVFIGGSGKKLPKIVALALEKNQEARIVINAVTLETQAEATSLLSQLQIKEPDIVTVSCAKSRTLGEYHLMGGMNPVMIISFGGKEHL